MAASTSIPVIAVPIKGKSLDGIDSLLSMVQMPPGVPVATVGINAGKNAGLLAASILGLADQKVMHKLKEFRTKQKEKVLGKNKDLKDKGFKAYGGKLRE